MRALTDAPAVGGESATDPAGWNAELALGYRRVADRTVLAHRWHRGPLRVQKALYPEGQAICHTVILHPPAGVAGGDRLDVDVEVGDAAHAVLCTPGATKWYRAQGRSASQRVRIRLDGTARLDWLPQENILFDGSRPRIRFELDAAAGARAIGWEVCVLGRHWSGECWRSGDLRMNTRILRDGRALWIEEAGLPADSPLRDSPLGLAGFEVFGTLWAVGGRLDAALAEACADGLPFDDALRAGISWLPDGGRSQREGGALLMRVLGRQIEPVRELLVAMWTRLREPVLGVPARPLRLWAT